MFPNIKAHRESSAPIKEAAMLQIRTFPLDPNIKFGASLFGHSLKGGIKK